MAEGRVLVLKHSIQYDSNSRTIILKIVGNFTVEDADEVIVKVNQLTGNNPESNVLADFTQSPNLVIDRETRRMIQNAALKYMFQKVAFVGVSPVTRMIAKVIIAVLGKIKESRFFKTEAEAIAWLKGEKG